MTISKKTGWSVVMLAVLLSCFANLSIAGFNGHFYDSNDYGQKRVKRNNDKVQLGPRPQFLVQDMDEGPLKTRLMSCEAKRKKYKKTDFSIGHRGAAMQFPEHTKESYVAAAKMGAGILECDVTFTKDKALVCRHSQCDLHTTTNILATPLAQKCSVPPAFDGQGNLTNAADIKCCTSDITVAEFKTLQGKMDAADTTATTVEGYMNATAAWRTDLYSGKGTVMTHAESIELFKELGVKMTPELKSPSVEMPFDGMTQEAYAQKMIDEYKDAGVSPKKVYAQSFNYDDVVYWVHNAPRFGQQAVFLDGRYSKVSSDTLINRPENLYPTMEEVVADGVNIIAPPMWMLVKVENGEIVPSPYAKAAQDAGLDIITWTLERSGLLKNGGGWYYQSTNGSLEGEENVINNDGDVYTLLDVLAQDVHVLGVFSDWPATTSFYANCMYMK